LAKDGLQASPIEFLISSLFSTKEPHEQTYSCATAIALVLASSFSGSLLAQDKPYVNVLVVRDQDKDKPWAAKLVKAYHSEEVRKFIQTEFKGSVLAGF
jgi:ABC-type metal ion transport system substrate-binding protein